jgi:hypothetical protein
LNPSVSKKRHDAHFFGTAFRGRGGS